MVGRGPVNYHVERMTMFQKPRPKPMNDLAILATLIVPQLASSFGQPSSSASAGPFA